MKGDFPKFWENTKINFSEDFKNLINSMLHSVPEKRASIETILKDPWFLND